MSGRATLSLALALAAWSGPAYAWAPARAEDERAGGEAPPGEAAEPIAEPGEAEIDPASEPSEAELDAAPDAEPPTTEKPAAPEPGASTDEPALTHDVPADDFEAEAGVAPGGYYGHGVILERPPPDGRNRIIVGSILVPLGTIATVSSAVGSWLTVPEHCERRLASVGIEADAARCPGLFTFNVVRMSYGVLMLGSGATILALGIIQRERYRKWRHEHGMRARLEPALGPALRGASVGLRLRF